MNKQELIAAINEYITSNGVQEITGQVMNLILTSIANIIPDDTMLTSSYGGVVKTTDTISTTPGIGRWFIAEAGTYPNNGGFTFLSTNLNILSFDGINWEKSEIFVPVKSIDDIEKTSSAGLVDTYTITYTDGSTPNTFDVTNGETTTDWDAGIYAGKSLVIKDNLIWRVADGQTAASNDVPGVSNKWKSLGAKAFNTFIKEDNVNAATMNATAKYITERIGIIPEVGQTVEQTYTNGDGQTSVNLRPNNTLVSDPSFTNGGIFHNMATNGAIKIVLTGYLLKSTADQRAGVLGIKSNGDIVDITAGFSDYVLLNNNEINVEAYEKISVAMTGAFTMVVTLPAGAPSYPRVIDNFVQSKDLITITDRIAARYISTYNGTTAVVPDNNDWEVTPFIKTKAGDHFTGEVVGRTDAYSYALYDTEKKFIKGVILATSQNQIVNLDIAIADDGYICIGNLLRISAAKIYLNRTNSFSTSMVETLNKIEPKKVEKFSAATPLNLASAKFYEPYIDGGVLKVKTPATFKEKLVLNNEDHIIENRFLGEPTIINFKGRILMYHSEANQDVSGNWRGFLSVGELGEESEKYTYLQIVLDQNIAGVPNNYNVHRSQAFVYNNLVYLIATVELGANGEVWMFKSSDGFNFTKVKVIMTLAQSSGFSNFGHFWIVPDLVNGYFYAYYDGTAGSGGTWIMKVARATSIEGDWSFVANVTGAGIGAMRGGTDAKFHNGKFRVFYHFGINNTGDPNLPTHLGYAEAEAATPQTLTGHIDLLGRENSPIGAGTDQNGDQAMCEINGSIWWAYQYAINTPILNGVLCYKKIKGLTYDKLFT